MPYIEVLHTMFLYASLSVVSSSIFNMNYSMTLTIKSCANYVYVACIDDVNEEYISGKSQLICS